MLEEILCQIPLKIEIEKNEMIAKTDERLKLSIMEMVDECEYNLRSFKDITDGVTIETPTGDGQHQKKNVTQERADLAILLGHAYRLIVGYRAHEQKLLEIESKKLSGEGVVKNTINEFEALFGGQFAENDDSIHVEETAEN